MDQAAYVYKLIHAVYTYTRAHVVKKFAQHTYTHKYVYLYKFWIHVNFRHFLKCKKSDFRGLKKKKLYDPFYDHFFL